MVEPVDAEHVERLADVVGRPLLAGMRDQPQARGARGGEDARELFGRMAELGRIEPDRGDAIQPRPRRLQCREGVGFVEVAQEAQDQRDTHAVPRLRLGDGIEQPAHHRVERDAACGVRLRIEHDFGVNDAIGGGTVEIGGGKVAEILGLDQDVGALIVDIEEILQPGEAVRRAHLVDRREGDGDLVALGEREHQFGLQRPFDVEVQLRLGQAGDEGVEV